MAFKNEYVLPLEQETSEFFRQAQKTLKHASAELRSTWTVDREHDMVLFRRGSGREEGEGEDYWDFLDRKGKYSFTTYLLSKSGISLEEIAITRQIGFRLREGLNRPDTETIACIKEALKEYSRSYLFNLEHYKRAQLTLIDSNGKEI
ncbi:MAG: hypothetical protein Q8K43_01180 [Sulfurimicrobium sp.]|nr:hypothetical protein [Sulfurimicrobium sp.]MDP2961530.1 hypothetical protein [Sulfurimicrobium sp.]